MKTLILVFLLSASLLAGQNPIRLTNPSFEDVPSPGLAPRGWTACGFEGETPPDVQPSIDQYITFFGVAQPAMDGSTYLGMVVRSNETWESVSQTLETPLQEGVEYRFSLFLSRSYEYQSYDRVTSREANYTTPALLRIWAGNGPCPFDQLLAETVQVDHNNWRQYLFTFVPCSNWESIRLEAYYSNMSEIFPYNGNLLIDKCSELVPAGHPLPFTPNVKSVTVDFIGTLSKHPMASTSKIIPNEASPANRANSLNRSVSSPSNPERKNNSLFTSAELYAMDISQLEDYMVWWFQPPRPLTKYGGLIFKIWQFEETLLEKGFAATIESLDFSEFGALVKDLNELGMEKTLELVEQFGRISRKPLSLRKPGEQTYYLSADQLFSENEITEPLWQKRLEYIEAHKDLIIKELAK